MPRRTVRTRDGSTPHRRGRTPTARTGPGPRSIACTGPVRYPAASVTRAPTPRRTGDVGHLPADLWRRSGRPLRGHLLRGGLAAFVASLGLLAPSPAAAGAFALAGVGLFFALPWWADRRLGAIGDRLRAQKHHEALETIRRTERARVLGALMPHGWVHAARGGVLLRAGDGRGAAAALEACGRVCGRATDPRIVRARLEAHLVAGDADEAARRLSELGPGRTPEDELAAAVVALATRAGTKAAGDPLEAARPALAATARWRAAFALYAARTGDADEARTLLATIEDEDDTARDPVAATLARKARKALRDLDEKAGRRRRRGRTKGRRAGDARADERDGGAPAGRKQHAKTRKKGGKKRRKDRRKVRRERRRAARAQSSGAPAKGADAATEPRAARSADAERQDRTPGRNSMDEAPATHRSPPPARGRTDGAAGDRTAAGDGAEATRDPAGATTTPDGRRPRPGFRANETTRPATAASTRPDGTDTGGGPRETTAASEEREAPASFGSTLGASASTGADPRRRAPDTRPWDAGSSDRPAGAGGDRSASPTGGGAAAPATPRFAPPPLPALHPPPAERPPGDTDAPAPGPAPPRPPTAGRVPETPPSSGPPGARRPGPVPAATPPRTDAPRPPAATGAGPSAPATSIGAGWLDLLDEVDTLETPPPGPPAGTGKDR